jgi:CBS domain-containing protein
MHTIHELTQGKTLHSVDASQSVLEAARLMLRHRIGAVPVMRGGEMAGIFTERDVMNRVVAEQRDPSRTLVADVMTSDPLTVGPGESAERCMQLMKQHGFRHLPIVDGKRIVGVVSLRDLLLKDNEEKDGEVQAMRAYIHTNT